MKRTKVYTVIVEEIKNDDHALNVLMTTTDRDKALRKFKREVNLDKKTNPLWLNAERRDLFDDEEDYYYVYDYINGCLNGHKLIRVDENILV